MADVAWVDVLPRMKDFAAPLTKGVQDASKKAGTEGGRALVDAMNAEAKKADLDPVIRQLEKTEKASKQAAEAQAASARSAEQEIGRAQGRIINARSQEAAAAAQLVKAEGDLEKRRDSAAAKAEAVARAEADLSAKRQSLGSNPAELARAEDVLAEKRRAVTAADADVAAAEAKLEAARAKHGAAAGKTAAEENALRAAVRESQLAQDAAATAAQEHAHVQAELGREVERAAAEADRAVPLWKRMWEGVGDTDGLKAKVKNGLAGVREELAKESSRITSRGESLLGGIGKSLKWGGLGLAAGAGGFMAGAATGGFKRLADIEDARASLTGLGKDAATVDAIMDDALTSVKGTAFGLGDAAKLSGTLVASGIGPGEDLQKTLSLVADSATIAKRDLGDMGLIWSSVASKGKLQGDDAMQLLESGIPIWQMIGDQMGITAGEAQELGSKGQVSFEVFRDAMQKNLGGAALESGKTVRGSFENMKAAVSRFGAGVLEGVFPLFAPALRGVSDVIDSLTAKVKPFMQTVTDGAQGLWDLIVKGDFTSKLGDAFGWGEEAPAVDTILTIRDGVMGLWDLIVKGDFTHALADAFDLDEDAPAVDLILTVRDGVMGLWDLLVKGDFTGAFAAAFNVEEDSPLVDFLFTVRDTIIGIGGWVKDNLGPIFAGLGGALAYLGGTAVIGAIGALAGAVGGAVAAIGWIPLAIGAAVGALTWFFTQTELGRGIVQFVWDHIIGVIQGAVAIFQNVLIPIFGEVWDVAQTYFGAVGSYATQIWEGIVVPAFEQFVGYLQDTVFPIATRLWTEYLQPTFLAIGAAAVWLWENALKPAFVALCDFYTNVLAPGLVWLWESVVSPVFSAIGTFIAWAWEAVIFPALDGLKAFIGDVLAPALVWLWQSVIVPVWDGISTAIGVAVAVISGVVQGLVWLWQEVIAPAAVWLWQNVLVPVWEGIKIAVAIAIAVVMTIIEGLVWYWENVLAPNLQWLHDSVFVPIWDAISQIVGAAIDFVKLQIDGLVTLWNDYLAPALVWLRDNVFAPVWNGIKGIIDGVVAWFRDTAWPAISGVIDSVKGGFEHLRDGIKDAWAYIQDKVIDPVASWFRDTAAPIFTNVTDGIGKAFDGMKDIVGSAFDAVREKARAPIDFVVNKVYNEGLKDNFNSVAEKLHISTQLPAMALPKGFARGGIRGGILPGSSSWRDGDDQLTPTRRGEGVLVSESLRDATSRALFHEANAAARDRGVSFASFIGRGFARGGIRTGIGDKLKDLGGDAIDGVKGVGRGVKNAAVGVKDAAVHAWDVVSDAVSDPKGTFKKLVDQLLGALPAAGLIGDVAKHVPLTLATAMGDKLLGGTQAAAPDAASGSVPPANIRGGASWAVADALARQFGLVVTSGLRRGAVTAGGGYTSLHALGRAKDYAASASQMMAYFNAMVPLGWTELLYSPAGARQKNRVSGYHDTSGVTKRNHYSHVHVGLARGGLVDQPAFRAFGPFTGALATGTRIIAPTVAPQLYDRGGWLQPGLSLVNNASGVPEPVFTGPQGHSIMQMLEQGGPRAATVSMPITATQLSDADVDRLAAEILRRLELNLVEEDL